MNEAVESARDHVGDALLAGLRGGAGTFLHAVLKGSLYVGALVLACGVLVHVLAGRWLLTLLVVLVVAVVGGAANAYLASYRAAAGAVLAANEEARLASHVLSGVFAVARGADNVTGGVGGDALDAATRRVAKAARALGRQKSGVRGLLVGRARRLLYRRVGAIAAVQLADDARSGGGVDWAATKGKLEGRIDAMVSHQVHGYLDRAATVVAIPVAVGALALALVVGLLGRLAG